MQQRDAARGGARRFWRGRVGGTGEIVRGTHRQGKEEAVREPDQEVRVAASGNADHLNLLVAVGVTGESDRRRCGLRIR